MQTKRIIASFGPRIFLPALIAAALFLLLGCGEAAFYSQAASGQVALLNRREPIAHLIQDPATPDTLKKRLALVLEIRRFAETRLALPVDDHYLTYADLERPFAVYSVFAAPEFSLAPKNWCYPVIGCAAYRGYFSESTAREYAESLERSSYDVYVAGVPAYSTLGWFKDPVLNTFVGWEPAELAALIFHELAHQVLYVTGDTTFNESFAKTVELEATRRWLEARGEAGAYERFRSRRDRQQAFVELIMSCRRELEALYAGNLPEARMRSAKESILQGFRKKYLELKKSWGGVSDYDAWMAQPLNNAKLLSIAAYHDLVPAFQQILAASNGDLTEFFATCERLAALPEEDRHQRLAGIERIAGSTKQPAARSVWNTAPNSHRTRPAG